MVGGKKKKRKKARGRKVNVRSHLLLLVHAAGFLSQLCLVVSLVINSDRSEMKQFCQIVCVRLYKLLFIDLQALFQSGSFGVSSIFFVFVGRLAETLCGKSKKAPETPSHEEGKLKP